MLSTSKRPSPPGPYKTLVDIYGSVGQMNHHIHVSVTHGFIYFSNPKVACSSTKATLNIAVAARAGRQDFALRSMEEVHARAHNPLDKPGTLTSPVFNKMMRDPGVFRFSFTREPVGRFCSAYLSKLDVGKRGSGMAQRLWAHMGWPGDYPLTLEEFGEMCAADPAIRDFDPHWKLQRTQIAYDHVDYGFLGEHHRFAEDFAKVSARIFDGDVVPVFDTRAEFQRVTTAKKVARTVSNSLRRDIETAYAADFEMLAEIEAKGLNRMP